MGERDMSTSRMVSRDDAVLVLVDMQCALAEAMARRDAVVSTSALLARVASTLGIPIIVTRQYPAGLGDTVHEVAEATAAVVPIDKVTFSCMDEPAFRARLEASGKRQVVLAGMESHICVLQTALDLLDAGYRVHVVADGVCSRRDADHERALERLGGSGAQVTVAESVIYEALERAGTPEFRAVLALVKSRP